MRWEAEVQEAENGDKYIEFSPEALEAAGLQEGDKVKWIDNLDGSFTIMHAERMDGYTLATEMFMSETNRTAMIYQENSKSHSYVVDLLEADEVIISRKITEKSEDYVEDLVENWVMCYGEFAKK